MRNALRGAAVIAALILFSAAAILGWKIYSTERDYKAGIDAYEQLAQIASGNDEEPGEIPASSGGDAGGMDSVSNKDQLSGKDEGGTDSVTDLSSESADLQASREAQAEMPRKPLDLPEINFKALRKVNPDIVGWIYSPDTTINYPVVQGEDNSYYLKHLADGTENRNGCPFVDVGNSSDFSDENSIIYGHHMQNGTMFAGVSWYSDQRYYDEHPVMYLLTPDTAYQIELFSGYTTAMDSSAYMQTFVSKREYTDWLIEVAGRSDFLANMEISAKDRVITLSTCAYSFENARYVVHGKLVEIR